VLNALRASILLALHIENTHRVKGREKAGLSSPSFMDNLQGVCACICVCCVSVCVCLCVCACVCVPVPVCVCVCVGGACTCTCLCVYDCVNHAYSRVAAPYAMEILEGKMDVP